MPALPDDYVIKPAEEVPGVLKLHPRGIQTHLIAYFYLSRMTATTVFVEQ